MAWSATEETDPRAQPGEHERFFVLSVDMLCVAGFDGYFKRLNPAWEKTLGFSIEELLARPYIEFVHPEDREATLAEAQKLIAGRVTISFENRYLAKDRSYKWLLWNATPLPEQQLIYGIARDITARKRAESRLAMQYATASALEESSTLAEASSKILAGVCDKLGCCWRGSSPVEAMPPDGMILMRFAPRRLCSRTRRRASSVLSTML